MAAAAVAVIPSDGTVVSVKVSQDAVRLLNEKNRQAAKRAINMGGMVNDIKMSSFFRMNWDELLYAAPNCLELMATCTSVAASDAASGIPLTLPVSGKMKYFDYATLKGCLAEVSNQGAKSFQVADRGMSELEQKCVAVRASVINVVEALKSFDAPISAIVSSMMDFKKSSGDCVMIAKGIYVSFDTWSEMTKELWACCTNEASLVEAKQKALEEKLAFSEKMVDGQNIQVDEMRKSVKDMEKRMDDSKDDYKRTLEDFPGAWTLAGQQIAMSLTEGLANAGTAAASIAAQGAVTAANPFGALAAAGGKFGASQPTVVVVSGQPAQNTTPNGQSSATAAATTATENTATTAPAVVDEAAAKAAKTNKESALNKLRSAFSANKAFKSAGADAQTKKSVENAPGAEAAAPVTNGDAKPERLVATSTAKAPDKKGASEFNGKFFVTDPAMAIISVVDSYVTAIQNILVNAESARAVDWDQILPPGTKDEQGRAKSSEAQTIYFNLERKKKDFKPDSKGLASQMTSRIIAETLEVVREMLEEAKKSKGLSEWQKPAEDSEIVKSWDERIAVCSDVSSTIKQSAASQPGMGPNLVQSLFPKKTEAETVASTNLKANIAEQTVKAATTKLTSAQEVYKSTMATYQAMNEQKDKLAAELTRSRAEVAELEMQSVTADNVRKVLVQCIGFLSQLKFKVAKLVDFFSSISVFVDGIVESQVKRFGDAVNNMIAEHPNDMLMQFKYNSFLRDAIFQLSVQIMGNFALCKDVALMYREVHQKCIGPGLALVDRCAIPAEKKVEKMSDAEKAEHNKRIDTNKKELSTYATKAETTIKEIVKKKQDEMIGGLKKRIDDIDQEIGEFPVELRPTQQEKRAIELGKDIAANAIKEEAMSQPSGLDILAGGEETIVDYGS